MSLRAPSDSPRKIFRSLRMQMRVLRTLPLLRDSDSRYYRTENISTDNFVGAALEVANNVLAVIK